MCLPKSVTQVCGFTQKARYAIVSSTYGLGRKHQRWETEKLRPELRARKKNQSEVGRTLHRKLKDFPSCNGGKKKTMDTQPSGGKTLNRQSEDIYIES